MLLFLPVRRVLATRRVAAADRRMATDRPVDVIAAKIVSAFKVFDANGNGTISKQELQAILMLPSATGKTFTPEEVDRLFAGIGADGSSGVDYSEFAVAWASTMTKFDAGLEAGTAQQPLLDAAEALCSRLRALGPRTRSAWPVGGREDDAAADVDAASRGRCAVG